jgi:hypothetical protein
VLCPTQIVEAEAEAEIDGGVFTVAVTVARALAQIGVYPKVKRGRFVPVEAVVEANIVAGDSLSA